MAISVGVVGGRGFVGGELLRLLMGHPEVEVAWATSETKPGESVAIAHPPLRGSKLRYQRAEDVQACSVVFVAAGHGKTDAELAKLTFDPEIIIDLGADYRLPRNLMAEFYEWSRPESSEPWTIGLPELFRTELRDSKRIAVPGCMAACSILMLAPLHQLGYRGRLHVDARTGSSGAGGGSPHNTHALRANVMRISAPLRHRHQAEIRHVLGLEATMTVSALPQVRGVQTLARVDAGTMTEKELRRAYAEFATREYFVRYLGRGRGQFGLPDPKVLLGSNYVDVALVVEGGQVLIVAALDNMMKGAAGNAVQCMNVVTGRPESMGLEFAGIHPI